MLSDVRYKLAAGIISPPAQSQTCLAPSSGPPSCPGYAFEWYTAQKREQTVGTAVARAQVFALPVHLDWRTPPRGRTVGHPLQSEATTPQLRPVIGRTYSCPGSVCCAPDRRAGGRSDPPTLIKGYRTRFLEYTVS
jgi:hypothetical protein